MTKMSLRGDRKRPPIGTPINPSPATVAATPKAVLPRQSKVAGLTGQLPLKPGHLVMTEQEVKDLEALGWKPGDPLPPNLASVISEERQRIQGEIETMVPDAPNFKPPKLQDISSLPPEKQAELRKAMDEFRLRMKAVEENESVEQEISGYDPSIQNAIRSTLAGQGIEVTDSRTEEAHKRMGTQPAPQTASRVVRLEELVAQAQATVKSKQEAAPLPSTGSKPANAAVENCPHCGWPVHMEEPAKIEEADKLSYVQAIMGGKPFCKIYEFFGGRMQVAFRNLTAKQARLAQNQVRHDYADAAFPGIDAFVDLMEYRMVFSIDKIQQSDSIRGQTIDVAEAVDDVFEGGLPEGAKEDVTPVPYIIDQLRKQPILANEQVWRMLREQYRRFNELVEFMEARSTDKDFWNPVGA